MPCLEEKPDFQWIYVLKASRGDGVSLAVRTTWKSLWQLCIVPATAPFRADQRIRESCLGKQDRLGAWNIDFRFKFLREMWMRNFPFLPVLLHCGGIFGVPDKGEESLLQVGIQPESRPTWAVLCAVPGSFVCFWPGGLHPPDFCFSHFTLGGTGPERRDKRMSQGHGSPPHWIQT